MRVEDALARQVASTPLNRLGSKRAEGAQDEGTEGSRSSDEPAHELPEHIFAERPLRLGRQRPQPVDAVLLLDRRPVLDEQIDQRGPELGIVRWSQRHQSDERLTEHVARKGFGDDAAGIDLREIVGPSESLQRQSANEMSRAP